MVYHQGTKGLTNEERDDPDGSDASDEDHSDEDDNEEDDDDTSSDDGSSADGALHIDESSDDMDMPTYVCDFVRHGVDVNVYGHVHCTCSMYMCNNSVCT